jgi:hypothetical protein
MGIPVAAIESLISSSSSSRDAVAVYDDGFMQVFPEAKITKATVNRPKRVMRHPLENGTSTVDHVVIDPIQIELSMWLNSVDYQDTYNQIVGFFINSTELKVQTRAAIYENQIISGMPHVEDTQRYDSITIGVKFTQVQFASNQSTTVPANAANSSTVDRGNQQPKEVTAANQQSFATKLSGFGAV